MASLLWKPHVEKMLVALLGAWLSTVGAAAERYVLEVPGQPAVRSTAVSEGQALTIVDAQGRAYRYVRRPTWDSDDGRYWAFHCAEADRALRWPVSGEGAMYLGEVRGGAVSWRPSQMRIRPAGETPSRPRVPEPSRSSLAPLAGGGQSMPIQVAILPRDDGELTLAFVDEHGRLQCYAGRDDRWQRQPCELTERLVPGAPLILFDEAAGPLPRMYSVDERGALVEIRGGQRLRRLTGAPWPEFAPRTHLAAVREDDEPRAYAVDVEGRLWDLEMGRGAAQMIEHRTGQLTPGARLVAVRGRKEQVLMIDRVGNLLRYVRGGSDNWLGPDRIGHGYAPGGFLTGTGDRSPRLQHPTYLATVDGRGRLMVLEEQEADWRAERVGDFHLPPGSPIALAHARGPVLAAIHGDGHWRQWYRDGGHWLSRDIADGFLSGAPVVYHPAGPNCFAVDRRGRLVAASYGASGWRCALCTPRFAFAPRLVARRIVPNPPLPTVNVNFVNRHDEALAVRIVSHRNAGQATELRIQPKDSWKTSVERDAGATMEEVFLVPGPLGQAVEQVYREPLPAVSLYDVVVYADRVTSVYFDRTKNKGPTPDSVQKSLVSLGVFPLPPGDLLQEDATIDVYQEAAAQRNPGAAAWYGPAK